MGIIHSLKKRAMSEAILRLLSIPWRRELRKSQSYFHLFFNKRQIDSAIAVLKMVKWIYGEKKLRKLKKQWLTLNSQIIQELKKESLTTLMKKTNTNNKIMKLRNKKIKSINQRKKRKKNQKKIKIMKIMKKKKVQIKEKRREKKKEENKKN